MLAPLMPLPIMTTSAVSGSSAVLRKSAMASGGSCQPLMVGLGRGRVGGIDARSSMIDVYGNGIEGLRRTHGETPCIMGFYIFKWIKGESFGLQMPKISDIIAVLGLANPLYMVLEFCGITSSFLSSFEFKPL